MLVVESVASAFSVSDTPFTDTISLTPSAIPATVIDSSMISSSAKSLAPAEADVTAIAADPSVKVVAKSRSVSVPLAAELRSITGGWSSRQS